jgi:DNA-binding response OmpR family regulator
MPRVLVVEDERKILRAVEQALHDAGFEVVTAANAENGHRLASSEPFDCLVLDRMLPGRDGLDVLRDLRRAGKTMPVLILTARDAIEDRVSGLDSGADDYLVKPFAVAELLARLRVLLRRDRGERVTNLRFQDLEMDLLKRCVTCGGQEVSLTQREFDLLAYLLRHQGEVVTRSMLGRDVWKEPDHTLTNVIDVYINLLRRKLDKSEQRLFIHTLRGQGYVLRGEP